MTKTVRDLMTTQVIITHPGATARDAARLMARHRISGLPVIAEGKLVGIIADADLPGVHPDQATVEELMTHQVITVTPDTPMPEVAALMARHGIKRAPVMHGEMLVGIVSRGDLVRWIAEGAE